MDTIIYLDETRSTNEDAYKYALQGAPHGTSIVAKRQSKGKGRLGRAWVCPENSGLLMSTVLRPQLVVSDYSQVTLTAGVALCACVEELTQGKGFGLKWPNDLFYKGRKCGGILVESSPLNTNNEPFIIVGIGVNVNSQITDFPPSLQKKVTSLAVATSKHFSLRDMAVAVRASLLHYVRCHEQQGFETILGQWRIRDCVLGKEMEWVTPGNEVIKGIGMGPDGSGQLLVKDRWGKIHKVLSGDILLKGGN